MAKNVEVALEWAVARGIWKGTVEKAQIVLERLLIEIWRLKMCQ